MKSLLLRILIKLPYLSYIAFISIKVKRTFHLLGFRNGLEIYIKLVLFVKMC